MSDTETLNLMQKLAKIRAISDVVAKEKRGYNYSYADITSILAKNYSRYEKVWCVTYTADCP